VIFFFGKLSAFEIFQFSVAPKYALQNGQLNEYVLYTNGQKQSELNWEIQNISMIGLNATIGWEMLLLEADCMWGIPKDSGAMYDSDWLNTSNYGMKTNYSESDNKVNYLGDLGLRFGLNIKTWNFLNINPYVGIAYTRIKYTANGGTYWYGNNNLYPYNDPDHSSSGTFTGDVISYERELFNYLLGLKLKFNFLTRFTVSADFGLSVFTQINSLDHHILKDGTSSPAYYLDKMQGFFKSFNVGTEVDVKIWKGLSAGAGFKFVYINQLVGNDYQKTSSETKYSLLSTANSAADGYTWNVEAFVRYSF
jgi:outer membrane protease